MKKMLLTLLLAVVSTGAFAQFERGTKYVNTSLTGLNLNFGKDMMLNLGLDATGGYFLEDSWMLYGRLGFTHEGIKGKYNDVNRVKIGVGGRYYIEQNGLYLNMGLQYEHASTGEYQDFIQLTPEVGYCFYLNHYVSVEPAVYYDISLNHFSDASRFGLKVGFGFYF